MAAILVADVVGYSGLIEANEGTTLAALKQLMDAILVPRIADKRGRILKFMGDGLVAEFASVVGAVRRAAMVQQQRPRTEPSVNRAADRAPDGINLGDVVVDGDDLLVMPSISPPVWRSYARRETC